MAQLMGGKEEEGTGWSWWITLRDEDTRNKGTGMGH